MEIAMMKNEVCYKENKRDSEEELRISHDMHSLSNLQSFNDMLSQHIAQEDLANNLDITSQYFIDVSFTSNIERNNHFQILKNHFMLLFKVNYPEDFYEKIKSKEYNTILGLEKSSKQLICFSVLHIKSNKKKAVLLAFGVVKEFQNKKIGTKILQKTLEELTIMGIETVTLIVQQSNESAIRLYKKFGFEVDKELNEYYYYFDNEREKLAYLMKKVLIQSVTGLAGFFDFIKSLSEKRNIKIISEHNLERP
jgi:ribosomal protein S18 acetylase RimI-like enzyme